MTLNPPVQGEQEVVIYDPVYVVPAILVFPWIPVSSKLKKCASYTLRAFPTISFLLHHCALQLPEPLIKK